VVLPPDHAQRIREHNLIKINLIFPRWSAATVSNDFKSPDVGVNDRPKHEIVSNGHQYRPACIARVDHALIRAGDSPRDREVEEPYRLEEVLDL
jgi:hypothetical protein